MGNVKKMIGGGYMGSGDKGPATPPRRPKVTGVHIKKAKGGHVVSHSHEGPYFDGANADHVFGKGQHKKLMNHVARQMGVPLPYGSDAEEAGESAADEAAEGEA